MALLTKHQKNALSILKDKVFEAKSNFIEALEIYFLSLNKEPSKDNWPEWSKWYAFNQLKKKDVDNTLLAYHLAFIRYDSYRRVALGEL